jgi:N-acetylglutamate synthase-like GNAT family acetyltransferase
MTIEPFDKIAHTDSYISLSAQYGIPGIAPSSIPAIGYVAWDNGVAVAYSFLRQVEGGYGQIDGLIVNPEYRGEIRDSALDLVIQECFKRAKAIGITQLFCMCKINAPIERAKKHGFVMAPHSVLAIDLAKEV